MTTRYSKEDIRSTVAQLDIEAKQAGLLPMDHKLVYNAGSTSNGISATVMVQGPNGNYVHGYDRFIPEFTYKTTTTMQHRLLTAAINVLYALRLQREDAAKAARQQLAERGL
jgi:hypothetical protein